MNDKNDEFGGLDVDEGDFAPASESKQMVNGIEVPTLTKRARKPMTRRQKIVRVMLRRAGLKKIPLLDDLMKGKKGTKFKISDIAFFANNPPKEPLAGLASECPLRNTISMNAELVKGRMVAVGSQILAAGRMYQPIICASIKTQSPDGKTVEQRMECVSGRHRLAFLALTYGGDAEVPVYVEEMDIKEAREAAAVSNQGRPMKARERAELAVMGSVGGDSELTQDELYMKMAKTKAKARKYCVYSVVERGYPAKLNFKISLLSSRPDGGLTTLTNVENFWSTAMTWSKKGTREEYDRALEWTVKFLNDLATAFQRLEGFDASHHMAAKPMTAIGKVYLDLVEENADIDNKLIQRIAEAVVGLGKIGRQETTRIYQDLTAAL